MKKAKFPFIRAAALPDAARDTMHRTQLLAVLGRWGYSIERFALWAGYDQRTGRRWIETMESTPPPAVVKLVMLLDVLGLSPDEVDKKIKAKWL